MTRQIDSAALPVSGRVRLGRRVAAPPPHAYFVGSAIFHYLGPAFAVLLFARVQPLGVAWLRIVSAGLMFAAWRKPWRKLRLLDATTVRVLAGLGVVFAVMNSCFYLRSTVCRWGRSPRSSSCR